MKSNIAYCKRRIESLQSQLEDLDELVYVVFDNFDGDEHLLEELHQFVNQKWNTEKPKIKIIIITGMRNLRNYAILSLAPMKEELNEIFWNISESKSTDELKEIFINRFGGVQHQGTLNKALRRIIRDCNDWQLDSGERKPVLLPPFSCHSLRHTCNKRTCNQRFCRLR